MLGTLLQNRRAVYFTGRKEKRLNVCDGSKHRTMKDANGSMDGIVLPILSEL